MIIFVLEIITTMLLMRAILGYEFEHNKVCIAVSGILIAAFCISSVFFSDEIMDKTDYLWLAVIIAVPVLMFHGRKLTLVCISICMTEIFHMLYSLCLGVNITLLKGKTQNLTLSQETLAGVLICFFVVLVMIYPMRNRRSKINTQIENLNPIIFIVFILCGEFLKYDFWYSVGNDTSANAAYGQHLVKSGIVSLFIVIVFLLLIILVIQQQELKYTLELNSRCIKDQAEQYRRQGEKNLQVKKFRHDYIEHINVLNSLVKTGNLEAINDYVNKLSDIGAGFSSAYTGNPVCDAIIGRYDELCEKDNIKLSVNGSFPYGFNISGTTLCILVSNSIKNAYEAVQKCSSSKKIDIDIQSMGDYVVFSVKNPVQGTLVLNNGIPASNVKKNSYGTANMIEAAQNNGGSVSWHYENGIAVTEIMMLGEN